MLNVIDFIAESAKFMARDLPQVWTEENAFRTLSDWMEDLRNSSGRDGGGAISSGCYCLSLTITNTEEDWELTRSISSATVFLGDEDESPLVAGYTKHSNVFSQHIDLPDIFDEDYFL